MLSKCIKKKEKEKNRFLFIFYSLNDLFLSDLDGFFLQQIQISTNNNDYP